MIASDEPGYYLENEFGIRLETDIESIRTPTKVLSLFCLKKELFTVSIFFHVTLNVPGPSRFLK